MTCCDNACNNYLILLWTIYRRPVSDRQPKAQRNHRKFRPKFRSIVIVIFYLYVYSVFRPKQAVSAELGTFGLHRIQELGLLATESVFFRPKMPVSGIIGIQVILGVSVAFRFRPKLSFLVSLIQLQLILGENPYRSPTIADPPHLCRVVQQHSQNSFRLLVNPCTSQLNATLLMKVFPAILPMYFALTHSSHHLCGDFANFTRYANLLYNINCVTLRTCPHEFCSLSDVWYDLQCFHLLRQTMLYLRNDSTSTASTISIDTIYQFVRYAAARRFVRH